ncbi:DMT family transporter [Desulfocurvus sp. DL9XJH121]
MPRTPNFAAYAALCLASLFWAGSFSATKIALSGYAPMVVVFGRMFLATLILAPFAGRILRTCSREPGDWKYLLLMVLGEPCLYFVFEANALRLTTSSQAGMITATMPLFVSVAAYFLLGERLGRKTVAGLLLAALGVVWLSTGGSATADAPDPMLGNTLEVLAMACTVSYIINSKRLSLRYPPLALTMFMSWAGTIFFLPLIFLPGTELPAAFPLGPTLGVVFLCLFATLGAFFCYNYGVKAIPASQAATFVNLIPVQTVIMGWLILDEVFTPHQFAASALVLAGVWLSQQRKAKPAA